MTEPYEVPALRRTEDILQCISASRTPVRASELLATTRLSKSTLYLLLESLERKRWIERSGEGYIMGLRLFELGSAYLRHDGLQEAFRRAAADFVTEHNEVVQLATLDGAEVVYLAREDSKRPVRLVSDIGMRLPAHCSALGKAIMAHMEDEAVAALLPPTLVAFTEHTIVKLPKLLAALAQVRRTGVALDIEEVSAGLHCFAAYVGITAVGRRIAVSTSIPIERLDARRAKQLQEGIVKLAKDISSGMAR